MHTAILIYITMILSKYMYQFIHHIKHSINNVHTHCIQIGKHLGRFLTING